MSAVVFHQNEGHFIAILLTAVLLYPAKRSTWSSLILLYFEVNQECHEYTHREGERQGERERAC